MKNLVRKTEGLQAILAVMFRTLGEVLFSREAVLKNFTIFTISNCDGILF